MTVKYHLWLLVTLPFIWNACESSGKKDRADDEKNSMQESRPSRVKSEDNRNEISVTGAVKDFTNSLSNNPQSGRQIDRAKAKALAGKLERQIKSAKKVENMDILALMSAKRLAGEDAREVIGAAKRLVGQEMKKDINRKLPEIGQLEIALASFQSRQYGMVDYYVIQLRESKVAGIKSAAFNLDGLMKYRFATVRQAVGLWEEALKVDSSNQAARLNIALVALSHGDTKTAERLLAATEQDWFVTGNLAVADKLALRGKKAQELCNKALKMESKNRGLLFNCALVDYQVAGEPKAALEKLNRANSMSGGGAALSDKIVKAIRAVQTSMAEQNKKAATPPKEAKEAPQKEKE